MKRGFPILVIVCALAPASSGVAQTWYPVPVPPERPRTKVILPAARDFNSPGGLPLRKLFDNSTRDPQIMLGPDGMYYMTATSFADTLPQPLKSRPDSNAWWYNDGVPLWRSPDLLHWETLGYVWTLEKDAAWAKATKLSPHTARPDGQGVRAVWAPEIHYIKGCYWIVYCMNYDGVGVLKSTTGKVEGPYTDVKPDGPLVDHAIDGSLFEDTDGAVYLLWNGYGIAKMKPDLSGLAEEPRKLDFRPAPPWGEGISMAKINGRYVFTNAGTVETKWHGKTVRTYDCFSATSDSIYGPYTDRYRAVPYAGHQNLFQDKAGAWWTTHFGTDPLSPWAIRPGIIALDVNAAGHITPKRFFPRPTWRHVAADPGDGWNANQFNDDAWQKGEGAFGDPAAAESGPVTDIATTWKAGGLWMRQKFTLDGDPAGPQLFLAYSGPVRVWINGQQAFFDDRPAEDYVARPVDPSILHAGDNVIAVRCEAGAGRPYFDAGLIDTRVRIIASTAREDQTMWRFTTVKPAGEWEKPEFTDSSWQTGLGGFGSEGTPKAAIGTAWHSEDIWLRRKFVVTGAVPTSPVLRLHHDEDVEVYVNGVLATKLPGVTVDYTTAPMTPGSAAAIHAGENVLAVHCHQTTGGQFIDVGIIQEQK